MKRRTFVQKSSLVSLGVLSGVQLLAGAAKPLNLSNEEHAMLAEFRRLLAQTLHPDATESLTVPSEILHRGTQRMDFITSNGERISLRRIKGNVQARILNN